MSHPCRLFAGCIAWRVDYAALGGHSFAHGTTHSTPAISLLSSGAPGVPGHLSPGLLGGGAGGAGVFCLDARPTKRRPKVRERKSVQTVQLDVRVEGTEVQAGIPRMASCLDCLFAGLHPMF